MARQKNYVNNVDLLEELYKSIDQDELTRKGLDMLMKLAQRTQRKLYYSCEDDKQQCLSEAYFDLCKRWKKFNPFVVRSTGFELLEPGDAIKFYLDPSDRETLTKCKVLDNAELCVTKKNKHTYLKLSEININVEDTKEGWIKANPNAYTGGPFNGPKLPSLVEVLENKFSAQGAEYDNDNTRIKVVYKIDGEEIETTILKSQTVVKDPNPFSYFTSICINGYAKGFKELKPKKDKGRFISLDAGFNNPDGTDLFNM